MWLEISSRRRKESRECRSTRQNFIVPTYIAIVLSQPFKFKFMARFARVSDSIAIRHSYMCSPVIRVLISDAALITNTKSVRSTGSIMNRAWIARTGKLNFDFFVSVSTNPFELNSLLWYFGFFRLISCVFLLKTFGHDGACGVISKKVCCVGRFECV